MLSDFITKKLGKATYEILKDGSYYGDIPGLKGVWAHGRSLDLCRSKLREVLEEWLVLKLHSGDTIAGLEIPRMQRRAEGHHTQYA